MPTLLIAIMLILFLIKLLRDSLFFAWLWQVKEYRIDRMMSHLKENAAGITPQPPLSGGLLNSLLLKFPLDKGGWGVVIAIILFLSYFVFLKNYPFVFQYLVLALFASAFLGIINEIKNRTLKRLVPTLKIAIIFLLLVAIYAMIALCWFYSSLKMTNAQYELRASLLLLFVVIASPLIISSIVLAIEPIFNFQKKRIIKKAALKMAGLKKIKVIGITGSYGKTSTKEFLYSILSQKYKVVKTEGNNNTNIGVAYTVLNKVNDSYDYFICEMGAYKRGEIAEICGIVKPEIGILTGINEQHIDLFGSIKNTRKAKFELIEALPESGLAIISSKFKVQSSKLQFKVKNFQYFSLSNTRNIKVCRDCVEFGFQNTLNPSLVKEDAECHCEEHRRRSNPRTMREESNNGIATLPSVVRNDSSSVAKFKFNILGKHYIENVLSAITVAEYLGMSLEEIKTAVEKIEPTEYMMRKLEGLNGAVFIDDSYSANFDGVIAALDYLDEAYKDFGKIIVFPGIIELGVESEKVHKKLFEKIREVCDAAYILETRNWKLGNWEIEKYPLDKGGGGVKCRFVFEKDFDKVAEMVKKDLMSSLISNPPTPLVRGANTVVLFESRGAGAVMGKLKVQSEK